MRLGVLTAALVGAIAAPTTAQAATLVNADGTADVHSRAW